MGKTYTVKTLLSDFKVTIPENQLLSKQAVTSKRISVSYTNLQLNPYSNTQLDLFCSDNLSFQCTAPSTWLTNCANPSTQLEKDVGCRVLQFITRWRSWSCLVTKFYNIQNTTASSMHGSQYVTNQLRESQYATWEGCWLQSSSIHHTMKIMKFLGHKILQYTKHNSFFKRKKNQGKLGFRSHFSSHLWNCTLVQLHHLLQPSK